MSRKRRIRKNIELNTSNYKNKGMSINTAHAFAEKLMVIVLAVATPVLSILAAFNLAFRIPDFYRYVFGRIEVSKNLSLQITDTELGSYFSQFMMHKQDIDDIMVNYEGINRQLFTPNEAQVMEGFRNILDVMLVIAIMSFVLVCVFIILLKFNMMAKELRRSMNIALIIYIVSMVLATVYYNISGGDQALLSTLHSSAFGPDDLLQRMFDERFTMNTTIVVGGISLILMMIIRYIVWRLTEQKGVFSEALRGVGK